MEILKEISLNLQSGEYEVIEELVEKALKMNFSPEEILENALLSGMNVVSEKFRVHEIFLPDVLCAAKAMYAGMDVLKPHLIRGDVKAKGKIVIGTVKNDLHDIGKNLVAIMLKGAGFEVIDMGNDVAPDKFVEKAKAEKADIIGMSALLTTTMPAMKEVIDILKKENLTYIKTVVGGAPVSEEFAKEIGATAYGFDANDAVQKVKKIMEE